jgi:hypothetical protein
MNREENRNFGAFILSDKMVIIPSDFLLYV